MKRKQTGAKGIMLIKLILLESKKAIAIRPQDIWRLREIEGGTQVQGENPLHDGIMVKESVDEILAKMGSLKPSVAFEFLPSAPIVPLIDMSHEPAES